MIRKLQMMAVWASPIVKDRLNEERNEVKVSRSVLESSGSRKRVADFNPLLVGGDINELFRLVEPRILAPLLPRSVKSFGKDSSGKG